MENILQTNVILSRVLRVYFFFVYVLSNDENGIGALEALTSAGKQCMLLIDATDMHESG